MEMAASGSMHTTNFKTSLKAYRYDKRS